MSPEQRRHIFRGLAQAARDALVGEPYWTIPEVQADMERTARYTFEQRRHERERIAELSVITGRYPTDSGEWRGVHDFRLAWIVGTRLGLMDLRAKERATR